MFDRANEDMQEAIEAIYADEYPIEDFDYQRIPDMLIDEVKKTAGSTYAPFIDPGSLKGLKQAQADAHLMKSGMSKEWCERAKDWSGKSIPAIVMVDTSKGENKCCHLGDGQRRLAYADAKGQKTIDAIIMRRRLAD